MESNDSLVLNELAESGSSIRPVYKLNRLLQRLRTPTRLHHLQRFPLQKLRPLAVRLPVW